jgi:predicted RNase H-like nuclease
MTQIIAIDSATQPAKTGLARAHWEAGQLTVTGTWRPPDRAAQLACLTDWLGEGRDVLLAVDAPLGWPSGLADGLAGHRAGQPLGQPANALFRRTTDRAIQHRLGKRPMDVGADRIARTAHAALELLATLAEAAGVTIAPAWDPTAWQSPGVVEVYPAATLTALGLNASGYKGAQTDERETLLTALAPRLTISEADRRAAVASDHVMDAVISLIAAADFLAGLCPGPEDAAQARREGWIWVREPGDASAG